MNTYKLKAGFLGIFLLMILTSFSQERVIISVEEFSKFNITGGIDIILVQDTATFIVLEGENAATDGVTLNEKDDRLSISPNFESEMKLNKVYMHKPEFKLISLSAYGSLRNEGVLSGDELIIKTSGATNLDLNLDYKNCKMDLSGASQVNIVGKVDSLFVKASGASDINAEEVVCLYTNVNASGASKIYVNPSEVLIAKLSGASSIKYDNEPKVKEINNEGLIWSGIDKDGKDREIDIDIEDIIADNINKKKNKHKFKGNFEGVEFGINSYITPNQDFNYDNNLKYMDLDYGKSFNVNINLFSQSINLIKEKFGIVTGLGLQLYNYRFIDNNVVLMKDSGQFKGFYDADPNKSYTKSKLRTSYLTVPLMLEFQTNGNHDANSFHISAGVQGGLRLWTAAVYKYDNSFKADNKLKTKDNFYLNPFKLDLTGRIGWNFINLYVNYSLIEMFQAGKGPELYPVSAGIVFPF